MIGLTVRIVSCTVFGFLDMGVGLLYKLLSIRHYFMKCNSNNVQEDSNQSLPTILFIHGSGSSDEQFLLARHTFFRNVPIATINLPKDKQYSIEQYIQMVKQRLDQIDNKSIVLVGVSMGGLIASSVALDKSAIALSEQQASRSSRIRGVCTIGTPFQGAPLAPLVKRLDKIFGIQYPVRYSQMEPDSTFLQRLNNPSNKHKLKCPLLTIGSYSDFYVPNEYALPAVPLSTNHQHVAYWTPGHIALTMDPFIFYRLKQWYDHL